MNRRLLILVLPALVAIASQARGQEVLVSIDGSGRIESIDLRLEKKLQIFNEYKDFREARLFQLADSTFILEISYGSEGQFNRVRKPMSASEVEELRRKVTAEIALHAPQVVLDRGGRSKLLTGTALLSLFYYGPVCPIVVEAEGGSEVAGLYLLTSATTMILPILLTKERDVTDAAASLALYGATRGIAHGTLLYMVFQSNDPDEGNRGRITAGWLCSMAEGVIGFAVADHAQMKTGHGEMIGAGGDIGGLLGLGTIIIGEPHDAGAAGIVLAGAGAGLYAGHLLGRGGDFTRGDSYLFRGMGTFGALIGVTITSAFDPKNEEEKAYSAAAMAGGIAGLALGARLGRQTRLSGSEGVLVNVGMLGGGLFGLGLMVLSDPQDHSGLLYLSSSSVGSAIGGALAYRLVAPGTDTSDAGPAWDLGLVPGVAEARGSDRNGKARGIEFALSLRLSCRF